MSNEIVSIVKDAPMLVQLVFAYLIIRGGHFGWDKIYKQMNGDASTGTRRAVEGMEAKIIPMIDSVAKISLGNRDFIQANHEILTDNRVTFQNMDRTLDRLVMMTEHGNSSLEKLVELEAKEFGMMDRMLDRMDLLAKK